ncbi:MAG TPA: HEAT repeat domain-containing protein [Polyangia bacterium]|nr:HEAT repeat domain-containing protein [Polyangia bacterium]
MNAIPVRATASSPAGSIGSSLEEALYAALGAADRAPRRDAIQTAARTADPDALVGLVAGHADSVRRNAAIDALSRGGTRSLPALMRALRHADAEVVMFAAGILGKTRDGTAVPELVKLLEHRDINVAQQAAESLGHLRSPLAVEALCRALGGDPWLRFAAVHALGEIGDPRAVAAIVPLLDDEMLCAEVTEALGKIGSREALTVLVHRLRQSADPEAFRDCLRALGEALHRHPDHEVLRKIEACAELRSPAARAVHDRLSRVLSGEEPAPERASPERDMQSRQAAVALVHALKLRSLYSALVLAGKHGALKETLAFCAVSLGSDIVPFLREGLWSGSRNVRALACHCLGALGCRDAADSIAMLLKDPHAGLRVVALKALAVLRADRQAHQMVPLLADEDAGVRRLAVVALGQLDPEIVTLVLLTARPQKTELVVRTLSVMRANPFADQRPFIARCLAHEAPEVRLAAVAALAAQKDDGEIVPDLAALAGDPNVNVRRGALEAIAATGTAEARRLLLGLLERPGGLRPELVRIVATLGDVTVVPRLVRILGSADAEIRREAVAALGQFATPIAIRHVAAAARDADERVREKVARVLSRSQDPGALAVLEGLCLDPSPEVASVARQKFADAA